jgi:hypothetical protein
MSVFARDPLGALALPPAGEFSPRFKIAKIHHDRVVFLQNCSRRAVCVLTGWRYEKTLRGAFGVVLPGLEALSRKDCGLILAGLRTTASQRESEHLLTNRRRQRLIERHGRGEQARFKITESGLARLSLIDPQSHWNRLL